MSTEDISSLTREELASQYGVEMAKKDEMVAAAQAVAQQREVEAQQRATQREADQAALANSDLSKRDLSSAARDLHTNVPASAPVPELAQAIAEAVQPVVAQAQVADNALTTTDDPLADFPQQPAPGQIPPRG